MYLDNYKHLLQRKNNCSKNHFYEKNIFGQKYMQSFFKVTSLAHLILFAPRWL
jgi:hypothetical protein